MDEEIIQEYLNGKSISKISSERSIPYRQIRKILTDNSIAIRGGRSKKTLTNEQMEWLQTAFYNGVTYNELSEKLKLDKETIRNIIQEHNFIRRNNNRINKRILSDYFSCINTHEKAYWLGFLFTDGNVSPSTGNRETRIRLQLQKQDEEILEKFKECLQIDTKIIYDSRPNSVCCSVEFVDNQIAQDLSNFGIIPNKTYMTEHLPLDKIPEEFITSFLLGLFDGDGGITLSADFSTDVGLNFTSYHESIVTEFQLAIDKLINKEKHNKTIYTTAWHVQWRGRRQVLNILDILYKNCPIHLKRKYNKYLQLKESLN